MKDAFVSVVMGTYNGERFLSEQIESILNQTHKNIELIIVDDASGDQTQALIKKKMEEDSRIRFYQNEKNLGYNKNFEKAICLAAGDFIAISDQDDVWVPTKIEKLLCAFTSSDTILTNAPSAKFENGKINFRLSRLLYPFSGNDTRKLFVFNQISGHCILFKKQLVSKILPIPQDVYYDWWIGVVATCNGTINSVEECLVYHRIHQNNSYFTKNRKNEKDDIVRTWELFSGIKEMNENHKKFLLHLIHLTEFEYKKNVLFSMPMFLFLFRHRKLIFGHKKRRFPQFTYLKYSITYAKKILSYQLNS